MLRPSLKAAPAATRGQPAPFGLAVRPRPNIAVRSAVGEPNGTGPSLAPGARVKVIKPIKVYHVPKVAELDLEGLEGELSKDVTQYKGKVLSANLPYVVKFSTQVGEKKVNFSAHLAEDELQAL